MTTADTGQPTPEQILGVFHAGRYGEMQPYTPAPGDPDAPFQQADTLDVLIGDHHLIGVVDFLRRTDTGWDVYVIRQGIEPGSAATPVYWPVRVHLDDDGCTWTEPA